MAFQEDMQPLDLDSITVEVEDTTLTAAPEPEAKSAPEPKESDDVELEVVDDTPPQDRNRKPLPDEVVKALDEEPEVEEYSAKVKERINQMKKAWHDERRAKEAALREREEAVRVAQTAFHERQEYLKRLQDGETWAMEQARKRAALELAEAKREYRDAYDAGDSERVVEAQQKLSASTMELERLNNYRPQYTLQRPETEVYSPQQAEPAVSVPKPDAAARRWAEENEWFGTDEEMTSFALGAHNRLVKDGVDPKSEEYYERIDARMREVFPDRFARQEKQVVKRQPATVVAPVARSAKGKKVVLTQTQVALAKKLGITPEQYARELVKQQEK